MSMGKLLLSLIVLLSLCGCGAANNPYLSLKDSYELKDYQLRWMNRHKGIDKLDHDLIFKDAREMAREAAASGDFRPIGIAGGLHASEDNVKQPFGLECAQKMELQSFLFGCFPPPAFFFKQVFAYNEELIKQPGFPSELKCQVPEHIKNEIINMEYSY